ncbi:uncharacterized protein LOC135468797 isoform X2 [Liolophura sinensis]|uniref:uncharacterized protein LOC135468797 isoform X2 n=1 Tax=Liolophura sinensis TaxID=3198878 RepID=UPI0031588A02
MAQEDEGEDALLVGILLTSDCDLSRYSCLGLIQITDYHLSRSRLDDMRNLICAQLNTIPSQFAFMSTQGWPVTREQERYVYARNIVSENSTLSIQRVYDTPRIGVKAKSGLSLGFVFVDYDCAVDQLREIVESQLPFFRGMSTNYQFLDMNTWPISTAQEKELTVLDILNGSCIHVCTDVSIRATLDFQTNSRDSFNSDVGPAPKRLRGVRELSYRSSKDIDRRHSDDSGSTEQVEPKQILISYVRAEAAQHALDLKQYLSEFGYSVYLDVHEIKTGVDWQDSLNFAVTNCEVFVPLVTPRYGETQWTNREVKLADVLSKFILPVSFIDDWPPRCLAIQFATTQYIYHRKELPTGGDLSPFINGHTGNQNDSRNWRDEDVRHVALEIGHRISTFRETTARGLVLVKQTSMLKSYPSGLPLGMEGLDDVTSDREGKPLIVISLHPDQSHLGKELTKLLENQNYEVWCSTELDFAEDDTIRLSQSELQLLRSSQSSQSCDTTDSSVDSRKQFQEKANEAGLVIVVLSQSFALSKTCQQQVYYCEHRKRMIPFVCEEFTFPGWLSMLLGNTTFETMKNPSYKESLLSRVKQALDPSAKDNPMDEINEARLMQFVQRVWKQIPREYCVYISGGTKFHNSSTEMICRAIGQSLAKLERVTLVTGGFYGVMESVSRGFYEETQRIWKNHKVWHILPERDPTNMSKKALQNRDGTFKALSFGKTMFCGSSVRERETIVARAFDICVLVEGGPGSAHEAEQFAWSDRIVIPIRATGGAAGGLFGVPQKIFKVPQCVSEDDWTILSQKTCSPTEIGNAVSRIISSIFKKPKIGVKPTTKKVITKGKKLPKAETLSKPSLTTMKTIILG